MVSKLLNKHRFRGQQPVLLHAEALPLLWPQPHFPEALLATRGQVSGPPTGARLPRAASRRGQATQDGRPLASHRAERPRGSGSAGAAEPAAFHLSR